MELRYCKYLLLVCIIAFFTSCASAKGGYSVSSTPRESVQPVHAAGGVASATSGILRLMSFNPMGLLDLLNASTAFRKSGDDLTVIENPPATESER